MALAPIRNHLCSIAFREDSHNSAAPPPFRLLQQTHVLGPCRFQGVSIAWLRKAPCGMHAGSPEGLAVPPEGGFRAGSTRAPAPRADFHKCPD